MESFKCLPLRLRRFVLESLDRADCDHELVRALNSWDDTNTIFINCSGILEAAESNTKIDQRTLIKRTGLTEKDQEPDRFSSAFAELRVVNHLSDLGFVEINFPPEESNRKNADIFASLHFRRYQIEVLNKSHSNKIFQADQSLNVWDLDYSLLARKLICAVRAKKSQIDESAKDSGVDVSVVVCVLDSEDVIAMSPPEKFETLVKEVAIELNWGENFHFGILANMTGWFVCPSFPVR